MQSAALPAKVSFWLVEQDQVEYPFAVYRNKSWGKVFKLKFPKSYFILLRDDLSKHGIARIKNMNGFYLLKGLVNDEYVVQVIIEGDTEWGSLRIFRRGQFENVNENLLADNTDLLERSKNIPQLLDQQIKDYAYGIYEEIPACCGDNKDYDQFIHCMVIEPFAVQNIRISGEAVVAFIIAPDGRVLDVDLLKKADNKFDQFVLYTFRISPNWKPAVIAGRNQPVQWIMPMKLSVN